MHALVLISTGLRKRIFAGRTSPAFSDCRKKVHALAVVSGIAAHRVHPVLTVPAAPVFPARLFLQAAPHTAKLGIRAHHKRNFIKTPALIFVQNRAERGPGFKQYFANLRAVLQAQLPDLVHACTQDGFELFALLRCKFKFARKPLDASGRFAGKAAALSGNLPGKSICSIRAERLKQRKRTGTGQKADYKYKYHHHTCLGCGFHGATFLWFLRLRPPVPDQC